MKIKTKLGNLLSILGITNRPPVTANAGNKNGIQNKTLYDMHQREAELYGEERINQQRLYERWLKKESWHLKKEALPLLAGCNPEAGRVRDTNGHYANELAELWRHARQCVEQGLLPVINQERDPDEWQVNPVDAYRWATVSRVNLPDPLVALMEFVINTVKQPHSQDIKNERYCEESDVGRNVDADRACILGMALIILASYPEKCRDRNGQVMVDKIISIINDKSEFLLEDRSLKLSDELMRETINEWLNRLPQHF